MCPVELFSVCKNNTLPPPFGVISGVFWNSALDGNTHVDTSSRTSDKTGSSRAEAISNVAPIAAVSVPRFPDSPNVCSFCSPNRFPRFGRIIPRPRPRPRPLVHGLPPHTDAAPEPPSHRVKFSSHRPPHLPSRPLPEEARCVGSAPTRHGRPELRPNHLVLPGLFNRERYCDRTAASRLPSPVHAAVPRRYSSNGAIVCNILQSSKQPVGSLDKAWNHQHIQADPSGSSRQHVTGINRGPAMISHVNRPAVTS